MSRSAHREDRFGLQLADAGTQSHRQLDANWPATGQPTARSAVVISNANLRSGPGTNYPIVGRTKQGNSLDIRACNTDIGWCQLTGGQWIFAELIDLATVPAVALAANALQSGHDSGHPAAGRHPHGFRGADCHYDQDADCHQDTYRYVHGH